MQASLQRCCAVSANAQNLQRLRSACLEQLHGRAGQRKRDDTIGLLAHRRQHTGRVVGHLLQCPHLAKSSPRLPVQLLVAQLQLCRGKQPQLLILVQHRGETRAASDCSTKLHTSAGVGWSE